MFELCRLVLGAASSRLRIVNGRTSAGAFVKWAFFCETRLSRPSLERSKLCLDIETKSNKAKPHDYPGFNCIQTLQCKDFYIQFNGLRLPYMVMERNCWTRDKDHLGGWSNYRV